MCIQTEISLIISTIVGLTGVITLIYSIRQRRNPMREYLYKKQFDFFEKLGGYVYEIQNEFNGRLIYEGLDYSVNDKHIIKAADEIDELLRISRLYISEDIYDSATDLVSEINKNSNFLSTKKTIDRVHQKAENLYSMLRNELGVEILHKENKNVIRRLLPF